MSSNKHILIVDDEEAILTVLKSSLKKLGANNYDVVTARDGFAALTELQKQKFDVVITDYNMAEMDGLELMETVRYLQPTAKVLMITAYGNDMLEAEARRLQAYRYLTKPLEIDTFRRIVQEALGDFTAKRAGVLILSNEKHGQVSQVMGQLQADVGARCTFLTNAEGRTIARTGQTDKLPMTEIASLLGGGMATLTEAGRTLHDALDNINLAYHEGKREHLYAINIGHHLLLVLIIERSPYSSRLGSVWYYARQAAISLRDMLREAEYADPQQVFDASIEQAFNTELDKLLNNS